MASNAFRIVQPISPFNFLNPYLVKGVRITLHNTLQHKRVDLNLSGIYGKGDQIHAISGINKYYITPDSIVTLKAPERFITCWLRDVNYATKYYILPNTIQLEKMLSGDVLTYKGNKVTYLDQLGFETRSTFTHWDTMDCKTYKMISYKNGPIQFAIRNTSSMHAHLVDQQYELLQLML